jgi:hypothetical protein
MSEPENSRDQTTFTSEDALVVVFEGPGDNTPRPRRKNIPRDGPNGDTPQVPPPADQPPPGQ